MPCMPSLEPKISDLANLSRKELVSLWIKLFDVPPPKGLGKRILIGGIGYELQVQRFGGLKPSTQRRLNRLSDNSKGGLRGSGTCGTKALMPRSRLIREWNRQTHVVDVTEEGFLWKGERYRSLSAIARAITGTRWSGPRFFGLHKE